MRWFKSYFRSLKSGLQEPVPFWELPILLLIGVIDFTIGLGWLRYLFIAGLLFSIVASATSRKNKSRVKAQVRATTGLTTRERGENSAQSKDW